MKAKQDWIFFTGGVVKATLSEPERKLFQQAIDSTIMLNEEGQSDKTYIMMFGGEKYAHSLYSSTGSKSKTLKISLMGEFNLVLNQWKSIEQEVQQIWQALLPLCTTATPQAIRDALPEELVQCIKVFNDYGRTRQHNEIVDRLKEREHAQYERMLPRLQYYISLRMLV